MKKYLAFMLALAMVFSALPLGASAISGENINYFVLHKSAGSTVTASRIKNTTNAYLYLSIEPWDSYSSDAWSRGTETINMRGRNADESYATNLYQTKYGGSNLRASYLSGQGVKNRYYKLAAQYDSGNPYQYAAVVIGWTP